MINSFNLTLSGKHLICPSILSHSFTGQVKLGYSSLPYMTLSTSCQTLRACNVSFDISAANIMGTPLQVTLLLWCWHKKILSLSFILGNGIVMCLGVFLLRGNLVATLRASFTCMSIYFTRLGKFSFIIFQINTLATCCSSSPSGTPMIRMLEGFKLSQMVLTLSSFSFFFEFVFLPSIPVDYLFLPSSPNY